MIGAIITKQQIRKAFATVGRHDLDAVMRLYTESAVLEMPTKTVMGGRHQGEEAIRAWFTRWFERMPKIQFTVTHILLENPLAMGASNVAHVEWLLDQTDRDGNTYHLTGFTTYRIEGGKAAYQKHYIFEQDVVEEIWGEKAVATT